MDEEDDPLSALFERCARLRLLTEAEADKLTDAVASGEATEAALLREWTARLENARAARRAAQAAKLARAAKGEAAAVDVSAGVEEEGHAAAEAAAGKSGGMGGAGGAGGAGSAGGAACGDEASIASSRRSVAYRVRYRPVGASSPSAEVGALTFGRQGGRVTAEAGHRSMRTYYKQSYKPSSDSLGAANPPLHALMLQYAKAGVLTTPMVGGAGGQLRLHAGRGFGGAGANERSRTQMQRDSKAHVAQGVNNNKTMSGMKHFKNQSLNF